MASRSSWCRGVYLKMMKKVRRRDECPAEEVIRKRIGKTVQVIRQDGSRSPLNVEDALDCVHFGVASVIAHAMAPDDLAFLEQEFAANLKEVAAHETFLALRLCHFLSLVGGPSHDTNVLHVLWTARAKHVETYAHTKRLENGSVRIGENGEGALGGGLVLSDELGFAAADNDDRGGDWHCKVGLRVDGVDQGPDIRFASLECIRRCIASRGVE